MGTTATDTQVRKLTRGDRCDRCGAEAFVQATMPSGFELLFCGHHFNENESVLTEKGAAVTIDERHTINAAPSVSANV
jgi:hypothetical protein